MATTDTDVEDPAVVAETVAISVTVAVGVDIADNETANPEKIRDTAIYLVDKSTK